MGDSQTTILELRNAMGQFVAEREWQPLHSPKNLSMGLSVEAAELMEHFLWVDNEASRQVIDDSSKMGEIADEMADVACYLLALSNTLDIDLSQAILGKLVKNAVKYPAEKYRGRFRANG
jgi:NTP pyrophosphatase (non-canonical NTP hydrolase)